MEQEKLLKEILLNGAKGASAQFTESVMQRVNSLAEAPYYYQPLVSSKLKRTLVVSFGAVVAAIVGLCLMIALTNLNFVGWVQEIALPDLDYKMILMFVITFWIVFTINILFEKKYILPKFPFHVS